MSLDECRPHQPCEASSSSSTIHYPLSPMNKTQIGFGAGTVWMGFPNIPVAGSKASTLIVLES